MKKLLILLFSFFLLSSHSVFGGANSSFCNAALEYEDEINKTLPRKIDEFTEVIQISVNCDNKVLKYTKRILADESQLSEGWDTRKQRQHTQLHCNKDGMARLEGWTAMDVNFDKDYNYLITLETNPEDCN
tara:strand:- start:120 stop:512 length:393 start_codon:yes stop_codon:yes gene_type:complete